MCQADNTICIDNTATAVYNINRTAALSGRHIGFMSRLLFAAAFGGAELLKMVSLQSETIPPGLWEIAKDFPVLILFLGSLYYLMRWGERMLQAQRVGLKEVYDNNQLFLSSLLAQIERRQNKTDETIQALIKEITALVKEILILRGTVSEVAKIDDVIDRLLAEIRKNKAE